MRAVLCLILIAVSAGRASAEPRVIVGLFRTLHGTSAQVSCDEGLIVRIAAQMRQVQADRIISITVSGKQVAVSGGGKTSTIVLEGVGGAPVKISFGSVRGRAYRGAIRISARGGELLITNDVSLEHYVRGVVASEMRSDWPAAALQAQAVVARTLAAARAGAHQKEGFHLCDGTHCQVYRGVSAETASSDAAVRSTSGLIIICAGRPIDAFYCSTCGGMSANRLGSKSLRSAPYLQAKKDLLNGATACKQSSHYSWKCVISAGNMMSALKSDTRTDPGRTLKNIGVLSRDASGRAEIVHINGSKTLEVDGYVFWTVLCRSLGWGKIKSTQFEVKRSASGYEFTGHGLGHGVGMCQWGARKRAESGWSFRQILDFYYPGCRLLPAQKISTPKA